MKIKNRNLKRCCALKSKSFLILSFRFYFYAFSFSFLTVCLSTSLAGTETSSKQLDPIDLLAHYLTSSSHSVNTLNTATQTAGHQIDRQGAKTSSNIDVSLTAQPNENSSVSERPNTDPEHQLWQAGISALKAERDSKSKTELQQIIKKIYSVEFKPPPKTPEYFIVTKPVQKTEPNEIPSDTEVQEKQKKIEVKLPYEPLTDQTLQIFESLSRHPDQLHNSLELGEILFRSGNLKQAAVCYQQALNNKNTDDALSAEDTAWILFQIGNCLRNDETSTALQMYRQLITEYPDSPWTNLAKTRSKLINWYQHDKPRTLIDENRF